ncbi:MAG: N-acetylmuramoyl-L-alanine amidase, partial [Veillonella sp.]|nr:N-acetylmuramoyl-L-alanine amidase [Veillonella sp.]
MGGVLTISTMVMPVMAEDIATNQFVIPTTMPPLEPRIENPTFTVTDAPDAVVSSVKNGWAGIGYHFVIRKDGTIERGRPLSVVGAHAQGNNLHTIGICMARNFEKEHVG